MSKPVIEVQNITKKYKIGNQVRDLRRTISNLFDFKNDTVEIKALDDVSFNVEQGDVVGLIGPNGSGKSTLLKILSKITYPTSGKAIIRGRVSSLLEVGTGFHQELTGRENVFLNGSILGMKRAEIKNKFDEIVEFSGVEKFIDTPVKHFSSGMYVRLAFSVAAFLEPEILLVDEVLSVGDLEFRQRSMGKMNEVAKEGRTVIFVSHNLEAIKNICKNSIHINSGSIADYGNTPLVIKKYLSNFLQKNNSLIEEHSSSFFDYIIFKIINSNENILACGDKLTVSIKYKSNCKLSDPKFLVEFRNRNNQIMFACNNILSGELFINLKNEGELFCTVEKHNLNIGKYFIDLTIVDKNQTLFQNKNICRFEVVDGPFFPTNMMPSNDRLFLVDHKWYES